MWARIYEIIEEKSHGGDFATKTSKEIEINRTLLSPLYLEAATKETSTYYARFASVVQACIGQEKRYELQQGRPLF